MYYAEIIVLAVGIYFVAGFMFAAWFVAAGADRLDKAAKETGPAFRLVILPGAAALWIWLAWRLAGRGSEPVEATAHRRRAAQPTI